MATIRESLSYQPVELGFGTSGLRGLVIDMTDLECYINSVGFLHFLELNGQIQPGATVYVAGDLRDSTPRITIAVARAIEDKGYVVGYGGLIPTPAIASYALLNDAASIMVTGSHIPADRNGIKFYKIGGEILKSDEQAIKDAVSVERERMYSEPSDASPFNSEGFLKKDADHLPTIISNVGSDYLDRYSNVFGPTVLAEKKVVVYQHSAVGRDMLVELLTRLGADVTTVGRSDTFVSIDTENVTPDDQTYFKQIAHENPEAFAIVSTDGDSDRPFVIDENGLFHRGDELGAIVAKWLQADFAALPISSNDAVDQFLGVEGVEYVHTRIGSPFVIEAMADAALSGKTRVTGWEVNGGFLLGSDITINGKTLSRLPTRDAFFPIISALTFAAEKAATVSELFKQLPARFTQAGLIDDFAVEISKKIIETISVDSVENRSLLSEFFAAKDGFGDITGINLVDGIRIFFDNGDIAHLRPSGNAPQMRIYSVASTQERADNIVEQGIQSDGILVRIASRFS